MERFYRAVLAAAAMAAGAAVAAGSASHLRARRRHRQALRGCDRDRIERHAPPRPMTARPMRSAATCSTGSRSRAWTRRSRGPSPKAAASIYRRRPSAPRSSSSIEELRKVDRVRLGPHPGGPAGAALPGQGRPGPAQQGHGALRPAALPDATRARATMASGPRRDRWPKRRAARRSPRTPTWPRTPSSRSGCWIRRRSPCSAAAPTTAIASSPTTPASCTGVINGSNKEFLARQIVEVVQTSTAEALANGILRGEVEIKEKGPVAR